MQRDFAIFASRQMTITKEQRIMNCVGHLASVAEKTNLYRADLQA